MSFESPEICLLSLSVVFSPHIIFLSQSILPEGESCPSLCGSRLCHEISHSWFGLVIGARDWTEEWISEGFATYLEDIIWARAQQVHGESAAVAARRLFLSQSAQLHENRPGEIKFKLYEMETSE